MAVTVHHGDCRDVLKTLADHSADSIVTDPPYALSFMGKKWDTGEAVFDPAFWQQCLRVLKPGGYLLAFGGTRTYHRLASAIDDAGFEIRDMVQWLYASGFPKSLDISKAIDKVPNYSKIKVLNIEIKRARLEAQKSLKEVGAAMQTATNGQYGTWYHRGGHMFFETGMNLPSRVEWEHLRNLLPIKEEFYSIYNEAEREVIGVRGKSGAKRNCMTGDFAGGEYMETLPSTELARYWDGWGTALKPANEPICMARAPLSEKTIAANVLRHGTGGVNVDGCRIESNGEHMCGVFSAPDSSNFIYGKRTSFIATDSPLGRWPANVVHDGSDEVLAAFPKSTDGTAGKTGHKIKIGMIGLGPNDEPWGGYGGGGTSARFFFSAKAGASDRLGSSHPTVKPVDLMRWLCRLVTPPGGTILDPFAGSGTTGMAALAEGFSAILIEREAEYIADIQRRLAHVEGGDTPLFEAAS